MIHMQKWYMFQQQISTAPTQKFTILLSIAQGMLLMQLREKLNKHLQSRGEPKV